jgi:hypothetical protein
MIERRIHGAGVPARSQKVMLVQIADNVRLTSNGTMTWVNIDLDLPHLLGLGPYTEGIVPITNTVGATTNHSWKVVTWWSVDGRTWNGPTDVFAAITAGSGSAIQTTFSTATVLGPMMKYGLAVRNNAGTAIETAVVDAWLQFIFRT